MSFHHLEFFFALAWHYELAGGDLRLMGRLEAMALSPRPARLQLLEKRWRQAEGRLLPDWRETDVEAPIQAVGALVEKIRIVWPGGRPPHIEGGTANTAWHSVLCTARLDFGQPYYLSLLADGLEGPDTAAVQAMFRELASIAGLTGGSRGFPPELLGACDEPT